MSMINAELNHLLTLRILTNKELAPMVRWGTNVAVVAGSPEDVDNFIANKLLVESMVLLLGEARVHCKDVVSVRVHTRNDKDKARVFVKDLEGGPTQEL